MRNPDGGLDSACRRMLEGAFDKLLASLRLDVSELVVYFIEKIASGQDLCFNIADGFCNIVETFLECTGNHI